MPGIPIVLDDAPEVRVELIPAGIDRDQRLREAAAAVLGLDAAGVVITRRCQRCGSAEHGQPSTPGASVSRSRSRRLELTAAAGAGVRLGVDLERIDRFAGDDVDGVLLHPAEVDAVASAEHPAAVRAGLWTAKEALLKAVGLGLVVEPRELLLVAVGDDFEVRDAPGWLGLAGARIQVFEPAPGLVGALVVLR